MLSNFRTELHVHTVLSPCAEVEMIPPLIVRKAIEKGINLIAITDHNATDNIEAVQRAATGTGLTVLPGMEVQTREEVHSLCLFDTLEQVRLFQKYVTQALPPIKNRPDFFGEQFVVDHTGDFIRREDQLLITSANITLKETWDKINELDGLLIPAHVNLMAFGLLSVLGFVPTDIHIEALEISRHIRPEDAIKKYPQIYGYPLIQSGDVHQLDEFLGVNLFHIAEPSIHEIRLALQGRDNRSLTIDNLHG